MPAKSLSLRVFSEADALKCLGRLAVVYGDTKIADPRQRKLLAVEWTEAFAYFEPDRVHAAIAKVLRGLKFWPTIAEVMDALKSDTPPPVVPPHRAERREFAREGRTEAEEVAYRAAQCLALRRQTGFGSSPDPFAPDPVEAKTASKAMWVSDALRAHAVKHGYWRGETESAA